MRVCVCVFVCVCMCVRSGDVCLEIGGLSMQGKSMPEFASALHEGNTFSKVISMCLCTSAGMK